MDILTNRKRAELMTIPLMETLMRMSTSDSGECSAVEQPTSFRWINKPVTVIGEDFSYEAICLCAFPKTNGKVRYIVEDRGRLFIQRESQLKWPQDPEPSQTIGESLEITHLRKEIEKSRNAMDASTYGGRSKTEGLEARLKDLLHQTKPSSSGSGCPHCGYFHPPDGMCL